jgi:adenylate cyclase
VTAEEHVADPATRSDFVDALGRVLSSRAFARSERYRAFLSYVVSESVAGRGDRISERTVARGALGRGPAFDGLGDSSVRVTATRVRQALDRYYASDGAAERVRIVLPSGSYAPVLERCEGQDAGVALVPGVAVLIPDHAGVAVAKDLAVATADALVVRLGDYAELTVVGPTSACDDLAELGRRVGVSHVLDGRVVVRDGSVRLVARLVSAHDGALVWSQTLDAPADELLLFAVEDRWAGEIAARVADLGGVLLGDVVRRSSSDLEGEPELRARLAYYAYIDRTTKESIEEAVAALDAALALGHRTASLLAMRGAVANAAVLQGIGDPEVDNDIAEQLAREALVADSGNAHAYLVLGGVARSRHRWQQCRRYAEEAVRLAPGQPANLVSAGLLVASAGDWSGGMRLIEEALRLNPLLPVHVRLWLALGNVVLGHFDRALGEATLIEVEGEIFGPLYRALALSGLGDLEGARREVERLLVLSPDFLDHVAEKFTEALNLTDEQVTRIVGLLEAARPS